MTLTWIDKLFLDKETQNLAKINEIWEIVCALMDYSLHDRLISNLDQIRTTEHQAWKEYFKTLLRILKKR